LIRFLSLLSIACLVGAVLLLASNTHGEVAALLIFGGAILSFLLFVRSAILRVRNFARDAKGFLSGDYQEARLVSISDPKGWFNPTAVATIEFSGADDKSYTWDRDVPVPFPVAWSYRLGKRFNVPGVDQINLSEMLATQLRRQGLKLTVSRPKAEAP
jgi:hypothetical protein